MIRIERSRWSLVRRWLPTRFNRSLFQNNNSHLRTDHEFAALQVRWQLRARPAHALCSNRIAGRLEIRRPPCGLVSRNAVQRKSPTYSRLWAELPLFFANVSDPCRPFQSRSKIICSPSCTASVAQSLRLTILSASSPLPPSGSAKHSPRWPSEDWPHPSSAAHGPAPWPCSSST